MEEKSATTTLVSETLHSVRKGRKAAELSQAVCNFVVNTEVTTCSLSAPDQAVPGLELKVGSSAGPSVSMTSFSEHVHVQIRKSHVDVRCSNKNPRSPCNCFTVNGLEAGAGAGAGG